MARRVLSFTEKQELVQRIDTMRGQVKDPKVWRRECLRIMHEDFGCALYKADSAVKGYYVYKKQLRKQRVKERQAVQESSLSNQMNVLREQMAGPMALVRGLNWLKANQQDGVQKTLESMQDRLDKVVSLLEALVNLWKA